jgi:hypothetical protein
MAQLRSRLALVLVLALAGCQQLYGGKPDHLVNPQRHKPPATVETAEPVKYIDDCNADFKADPKGVKPQPGIARPLVDAGETAIATAEREKDPQKQVGLIKEAIDKYRNALLKDPYSSDATLKLAIAYDRVLRKGCAIAMLKRLAALSANPKFAQEANRQIDAVGDNSQWFKGYRKDAMAAVGR